MKYVIGADIGGTTVKLGLFQADGVLLEKWEIPTVIADAGGAVLRDVAAAVDGCLNRHDIARADLLGIGAGIPGPVLSDGTVNRCVNLGWGVFNVSRALSEITGLPVESANDANVAALGEYWMGGGKGYMFGTVLGSLFLTSISIGFNIMDVNSYWQQIIRGAILVIAISFNNRDAISFKRKEKAA